MKTIITAWLLLCSTCVLAAGNGVKVPAFERVQLPNGAVVLLMERHDVPLIAFSAVLRGGAISDPAGESGVASLLAGVLQKGAGSRDAVQFAEAVASVGGQIQTAASTESISVSGSFLARDQQLMVELLADMLQRPRLDATQFDTLRSRQIEFIRAAKESDLAALAPIYGEAYLFGGHPYGRSVDGSEASLAAIKHADLQQYYQQQIGADRLIIAVAGDFRTSQLKQRISQAFAGWRKAGTALSPVPKAAQVATRRVLLVDAPDSVQSYFWAGNVSVPKNDPRRPALDVTNTLFGGRFTSMLNTELRIRTGLSYSASSHFDRLLQTGHWAMGSFTQTETTIQALDLMLATLDKLHEAGLDPTMVDSGKSYVQGQFPLALETPGQWAAQLATLEFYGLDRRYIDDYSGQLAAVTPADARKVIDEVFPASSALTLVVIGNASAIREGLRKYGPITEMKLADPTFAPGN
jgi:predicted Zn-dependent peptidase